MRIKSAQNTQNHNQIGYAWYPRRAVASFPPLKGHMRSHYDVIRSSTFFANNFWQKWARDVGLVPQCSSRQGASIDMQDDLPT